MSRILITGAAGNIGLELSRYLYKQHELTLVDIDFNQFPEGVKAGARIVEHDLTKSEAWKGLLEEVEYVIHLAGNPNPDASFDELWQLNYLVPQYLYQEALEAKHLKRIIFASSIHAVDGYPAGKQIAVSDAVRPSGMYGVSKIYLEALANYYAFNEGIEAIGIRIGDFKASDDTLIPEMDLYGLAQVLTAADMNHLVDCCLDAKLSTPYLLVNGQSNNSFTRLDLSQAREVLGYQPQDNAFDQAEVDRQD